MNLFAQTPNNANKLDPKSVKVNRIVVIIISSLLLIAGVVLSLLNESWPPLIIFGSIGLILFIWGWFWSKKSYQYSRWWFEQDGLYIQRGVLWRKKVLLPQNRVQHTDVAQGPLERRYDLAKLVVHTAGTRDASVTLKGINFAVANQLRNQLIDRANVDAV